jgi:hypothetical protein
MVPDIRVARFQLIYMTFPQPGGYPVDDVSWSQPYNESADIILTRFFIINRFFGEFSGFLYDNNHINL